MSGVHSPGAFIRHSFQRCRTRQETEAQLASLGFSKKPTPNGSTTYSFTKTDLESGQSISLEIPNVAPSRLLSRNAVYDVREALKQARRMDAEKGLSYQT